MSKIVLLFVVCLFLTWDSTIITSHCSLFVEGRKLINNRPIIGILTQEISPYLSKKYPEGYTAYIAASYVKFVEGAGARVVPIWIGQPDWYYEDIISKINGILWPGGSALFDQNGGYADAGYQIYKIVKRINENGDYFPILGICLGFELLTYAVARRTEHRINCSSYNQPLPLEFMSNYRKSKLFRDTPADVIDILRFENTTANFHRKCVTEDGLRSVGIYDKLRILSLNYDSDGIRFISALEHVTLPFYGLQFHPEKNIYEWKIQSNIPHGEHASRVAQYFSDFFVNEARKNTHQFASQREEASSLIYNYPVTYTGLKSSAYVQCYLFNRSGC